MGSKSELNGAVLRAVGHLGVAAISALVVAAIAATVLMHWVDPIHWGLWTGNWTFSFGRLDDSMTAQQTSGFAFYLYAVIFLAVGSLACRESAVIARATWCK